MAAILEVTLFWCRPLCFCCVSNVAFMLTRYIYMTKPERSVSKQGHLQPHCHSKAWSPNRQLTHVFRLLLEWYMHMAHCSNNFKVHTLKFSRGFLNCTCRYIHACTCRLDLTKHTFTSSLAQNLSHALCWAAVRHPPYGHRHKMSPSTNIFYWV